MEKVIAWNPPVDWVKEQIENAGNTIGSVHFNKRKDGELRKMCYRLHVQKPSVAKAPNGTAAVKVAVSVCTVCGAVKGSGKCNGPFTTVKPTKPVKSRQDIDKSNDQMTVLDANKVVRDDNGIVIGRGAWRTVPLEKVVRISNKGTTYVINRS